MVLSRFPNGFKISKYEKIYHFRNKENLFTFFYCNIWYKTNTVKDLKIRTVIYIYFSILIYFFKLNYKFRYFFVSQKVVIIFWLNLISSLVCTVSCMLNCIKTRLVYFFYKLFECHNWCRKANNFDK